MRSFFYWAPLAPPDTITESERIRQWRFATLAGVLMFFLGLVLLPLLDKSSFVIYLPLAMSALVFGLPHGAIDHLVLIGLARQQLNGRTLGLAVGLYLLCMTAYWLLWCQLPLLALALFIAMTIYHWGKSDQVFAELVMLKGSISSGRIASWIHLLNRGTLPIFTPFVFHPNETHQFLSEFAGLFGQERVAFSTAFTVSIGLIWLLLLLADSVGLASAGFFRKQNKSFHRLAENGLLVLFFSLMPPLFAIGLYFSLWHGRRHCLRLSDYKESDSLDVSANETLPPRLIRFFWRAVPFTLAALLIGLGIAYISQLEVYEAEKLTAFYLVLIACLTFPHICVVEWMDAVQTKRGNQQAVRTN